MKRLTRVLALLLIFGTLPAVATDKAKALYKQGLDAEMRQDYETAYNFYHQAYELKPTDIAYRASFERVRFFASASHVHKGQLLEKSGKLQEALTEFEQAIAIDPSSFIAQQEANKVRRLFSKEAEPSPADRKRSGAVGPAQAHGGGGWTGRTGTDRQHSDHAEAERRHQDHLRDHRKAGRH